MMSFGLPSSACAMPKRCFMPPEKPPSALLAHVPEVGLLEQRVDELAPLAASRDALERREVIEHVARRETFG